VPLRPTACAFRGKKLPHKPRTARWGYLNPELGVRQFGPCRRNPTVAPIRLVQSMGAEGMPYIITALTTDGAVKFRSNNPTEALGTAVELMGLGLEEVSITDAKGRQYTPSDFGRAYPNNVPPPARNA
jgi:hypothetical protein